MCLMDWKLGRLIRCYPSPNVGDEGGIMQANTQRVGILVSIRQGDTTTGLESVQILDIDSKTLAVVSYNQSPYLITLTTHGDLPTRQLTFATVAGVGSVFVTEFVMPEDYLNIPLEELERQYMPWKANGTKQYVQ